MTDLRNIIQKLLINEEFVVGGYRYNFLSVEADKEGIFYSFVINVTQPQNEPLQNESLNQPTLKTYASDIGKGAIDYAKNNPENVAVGVGTAAVLGTGVGALFLAGILGGKAKSRKHMIKRKTRKQMINRKTRKYMIKRKTRQR